MENKTLSFDFESYIILVELFAAKAHDIPNSTRVFSLDSFSIVMEVMSSNIFFTALIDLL